MKKEIVNLGEYKVAIGLDDATLLQYSNYVRYISELKEDEEADPVKVLEIFSNIPHNVIMNMTTSLFEEVLGNLSFLNEKIELSDEQAKSEIEVEGEKYMINVMEKLKVGEHLDVTTVLESDKYNYPAILAILCRKPNEEYNDDFIANNFDKRLEMFSKLPVSKTLPLIYFFLLCNAKYALHIQNSMIIKQLREEVTELVENIDNLRKTMGFTTRLNPKVSIQLRKCKKLLRSI